MSKYQPLADLLAARQEGFWRVSFEELEAVLGFPLPGAAHKSNTWWSNSPDKAHQRAWLDAGWRVESVDRPGKAALFHRQGYQPDEVPARYFAPVPNKRRKGRLARPISIGAVVGGAAALAAALGAVAIAVVRRRR